ncbi:autotransporter outer membrane beta-barrel domain-containing protein [Neisseria sp. Ec49-e6-T10]|uniref:autotransporter family protein n=1 Tax=Neisseria sp. Ec49-e6-T10 TaxID=3140744 RepID=UPI003EBC02B3
MTHTAKRTSIALAVAMVCLMSGRAQAEVVISDSNTTVNLDSLTGGPEASVGTGVNVSVTNGEAITGVNQQWQLSNAGTISSTDANSFAIRLNNGNVFTNVPSGHVLGAGGGVSSVNSATHIINGGTIETTGGSAIDLRAGGGLENMSTGIIKGADYGLFLQNSSDQVINEGQIIATNTSGPSTGVYLNGGTVRLRNDGSIIGASHGVQMVNGNQTVVNSGTIEAVTGGTGVGTGVEFSSGGTLFNAQGGLISGGQYGVWTQNGSAQITTAGTITGGTNSVVFNTGSGTLTLQTGAKLVGSALGGGSSQIILEGEGEARNDFLNFASLDMTGTQWTLLGRTEAKATTVSSGRLIIGSPGFTGAVLDTDTVAINSGTQMVGYDSQINGAITNNGELYVGSAYAFEGAPATAQLNVNGSLINHSKIILSSGAPYGNTLNINGNYVGNNGSLTLGASLEEVNLGALANQKADRLLIRGDASGSTSVNIVNATTNAMLNKLAGDINDDEEGILPESGVSVVQVSGNAAENTFTMNGYVTGGTAFQFKLYAFGPNSTHGSASPEQNLVGNPNGYWDYRLEHAYVGAVLLPPGEIPDPGTNPGTDPGTDPGTNPGTNPGGSTSGGGDDGRWQVVPQLPSYVSLPNALFNAGLQDLDSLHRRLGEVRDSDTSLRGETFIRAYGGTFDYKNNIGFKNYGFDTDHDYSAVQLGGSTLLYDADDSVIRLGGALTFGHSKITPEAVDGKSVTKVDTRSISLIGTYLNKNGWYVDTVLSAGMIDGKTHTDYYAQDVASIDGHSYAASVEVGYPFALGQSGFTFEPQLQYIWQRLRFDDFNDQDGIKTSLGGQTENIIRAGFRLTRPFQTDAERMITPYLKANYLQSLNGNRDALIGSYRFPVSGYGQSLQVGGGVSGQINKRLSLYAEFAWQDSISDAGWRGWQFNGGLRYMFGNRK